MSNASYCISARDLAGGVAHLGHRVHVGRCSHRPPGFDEHAHDRSISSCRRTSPRRGWRRLPHRKARRGGPPDRCSRLQTMAHVAAFARGFEGGHRLGVDRTERAFRERSKPQARAGETTLDETRERRRSIRIPSTSRHHVEHQSGVVQRAGDRSIREEPPQISRDASETRRDGLRPTTRSRR